LRCFTEYIDMQTFIREDSMRCGILRFLIITITLGLLPSIINAGIPEAINYQGRLTDVIAGKPVEDGVYIITFRIYDGSEMGAVALWTECDTVTTGEGLFDVILGAQNPLSHAVFDGSIRYLGIQIEGYGEMYPRTPLITVPYSYRAAVSDTAGHALLCNQALWSDSSAYSLYADRAANADTADYVELAQQAIYSDSTDYADLAGLAVHSDSATYSLLTSQAIRADTAAVAETVANNSVTTQNIANGTILLEDINQNEAADGQVIKWNGSEWIVADDSTLIGQDQDWNVSGDDMSSAVSGNVGIGVALPSEKLDVEGNIHASGKLISADAIEIDGTAGIITSSDGDVDFDDDNLVTTGKILAGPGNTSGGLGASVFGQDNNVMANWASITGGRNNNARGIYSVICGGGGEYAGDSNSALSDYAFIGSGYRNVVSGDRGIIGGGYFNQATSNGAAILGGSTNRANGVNSFLGGGSSNHANGNNSVLAGGEENTANANHSTIGGGYNNYAGGAMATIPGGFSNFAMANYSFAAGVLAYANHKSSMVLAANVWAEPGNDYILSGGPEQIVLRADSGIYITNSGGVAPFDYTKLINTSTGAYLSSSGDWTNSSDLNLKENFAEVDLRELLRKIARLEISEWNYRGDGDGIRHIGPVAQDFYALFGLGSDDKSISTVDPSGIALAAIKELYRTTEELKLRIERIEDLENELDELKSLVRQLLSEGKQQ
jgi:hypothetical protein